MSTNTHAAVSLLARILLAAIFIQSGWGKLGHAADTASYMQSHGVPGQLVWLVIATELGGGLAVLLGLFSRTAAVLLAGFTILAAALFHFEPGNQGQMINFMKNLTIAGGLLLLTANGPGKWSVRE